MEQEIYKFAKIPSEILPNLKISTLRDISSEICKSEEQRKFKLKFVIKSQTTI